MTNEQPDPTTEQVTFAHPQSHSAPPSRGRRAGRAAAWVGVGAIGASVLTGVAFAANDDNSTPPSAPAPSTDGVPSPPADAPRGGPGRGGLHGHGGMFGVLKDVLHGEYVVADGDGTKTMLGQQGEVTEVSSTSLTVKSSDGFTATWSLSDSTEVHGFTFAKDGDEATTSRSDVAKGATVTVTGTKTTSTSGAATHVAIRPTDEQLAELRKNAPQRGFGRDHGRSGQDGNAPDPSSGATASSTGA